MTIETKTVAELIELGNVLLEETQKTINSYKDKPNGSYLMRLTNNSMDVDLFNDWSAKVYSFIKTNHKNDELGIYLMEAYAELTVGKNKQWYDKAMQFLKKVK